MSLLKALHVHRVGHASLHAAHVGLLELLELVHAALHRVHARLHLPLAHASEWIELLITHLILLHRVELLAHVHHGVWHEAFILLLRSPTESRLLALTTHLDTVESCKLVVGRMRISLIHLVKILNIYGLLISGHIIGCLLDILSTHVTLSRRLRR